MKLSTTARNIIIGLALIEVVVMAAAILPSLRSNAASPPPNASVDAQLRAMKKGPGHAMAQVKYVAASAAEAVKLEAKSVTDPDLDKMKEHLSKEQYNICFLKGTEPPFSGKYYNNHAAGEYRCAVCHQLLFKSDTKFDSGTGWPSFWEMAEPGAVEKHEDSSLGMIRDEVTCSRCGAHLGHVFPDGPKPSGLRYCINSLALEFVPAEEAAAADAKDAAAQKDGSAKAKDAGAASADKDAKPAASGGGK